MPLTSLPDRVYRSTLDSELATRQDRVERFGVVNIILLRWLCRADWTSRLEARARLSLATSRHQNGWSASGSPHDIVPGNSGSLHGVPTESWTVTPESAPVPLPVCSVLRRQRVAAYLQSTDLMLARSAASSESLEQQLEQSSGLGLRLRVEIMV